MTPLKSTHHPLKLAARGLVLAAALALTACATPPQAQPTAVAAAIASTPTWSFQAQAVDLVPGVYQGAYSSRTQRLYVTSAVGRPPVRESRLVAFNPDTLRIDASVVPAPQPGRTDGQVLAVYGVAVDDAHAQIWVTNSRAGSVAVYRQADLGLVKQFPVDLIRGAREVIIDGPQERAYVASPGSPVIQVFDTVKLQPLPGITLSGATQAPKPMALALDAAHERLYTVSLDSAEAFAIDTRTGRQVARFAVPGAQGASGIAVDGRTQRLYVVAQKSGDLTVLDAQDGRVLAHTATGAGALNVAFDPVHQLVYVANRQAGTVTVTDGMGQVQAQVATGSYPNHIALGPQGTAWVIVKQSKDDPRADRVVRIEASGR